MRVLEPSLEARGEALFRPRALTQRAGKPSGHGVGNDHRRKLTAGEDVGPDRESIAREVLQDALVEALEPGREQGQVLLARKLVDDPLVELPSLRRQGDHPVLGQAAVDALERRRDDIHPQDHSRATAVGLVVDLAARRPVPVVEEAQVELAAEDGGDGALFGDGSEDMGYEREDVEAQGLSRLVISRRKTGRHQDSAPVEVDLSDTGLDEREQDSRVELQRVVGRAWDDIGDETEPPAPLLLHL